jgi:hypothetical protein
LTFNPAGNKLAIQTNLVKQKPIIIIDYQEHEPKTKSTIDKKQSTTRNEKENKRANLKRPLSICSSELDSSLMSTRDQVLKSSQIGCNNLKVCTDNLRENLQRMK